MVSEDMYVITWIYTHTEVPFKGLHFNVPVRLFVKTKTIYYYLTEDIYNMVIYEDGSNILLR